MSSVKVAEPNYILFLGRIQKSGIYKRYVKDE